ncbi:MAG: hypothetical protein JWQ29_1964 [Phenylobacterium sp.]|nr:hypothetical protein [Phenylobacterium sp.]
MSEAAPAGRRWSISPPRWLRSLGKHGRPTRPAEAPLRANYRRATFGRWTMLALYVLLGVGLFGYGFSYGATTPFMMTPMLAPPAILAAVAIWALPAGDYAPVKLLSPLFFLFFAALVLWPNYLAIALPGLPWLTLTRIFGVPLTITLLICISVSKAFRSTLMACLNADPILWKAFVGLVVCQTISLPLSDIPSASVSRWILAQTNWTAIFLVSCLVFLKPGRVEFWAKMFFAMALPICFIGIWELRLGFLPWAGHIPSFLKIEDEAVLRALAGARRAATGVYRVQSTATGPLGLAELLGLTAPFALHFAISRYPIYLRLLAVASLPLIVFVILVTDSRLGVVSCLVALVLYLLFWAILRWRRIKDSVFAPAIVFAYPAFFCVMVAATFTIGKLRAKVWGNGAQDASTESRKLQWAMGIPKFISHPFGHGMGRAGAKLGFVSPSGVGTIDSYYLSMLLDIGILGFIVYFFIFIRGAWTGARAVIAAEAGHEILLLVPLSVCLTNFVIVKSVFSQDGNHPVVFMMLGAIMALTYRSKLHPGAMERAPLTGIERNL